jgi:hypothetical protein
MAGGVSDRWPERQGYQDSGPRKSTSFAAHASPGVEPSRKCGSCGMFGGKSRLALTTLATRMTSRSGPVCALGLLLPLTGARCSTRCYSLLLAVIAASCAPYASASWCGSALGPRNTGGASDLRTNDGRGQYRYTAACSVQIEGARSLILAGFAAADYRNTIIASASRPARAEGCRDTARSHYADLQSSAEAPASCNVSESGAATGLAFSLNARVPADPCVLVRQAAVYKGLVYIAQPSSFAAHKR